MSTSTLLHLDASPRSERSHSRKLGEEFLSTWQSRHAGGRVISHDLGKNPPPFVSEAWIEGALTPPAGHSSAARETITVSDRYVEELLSASELLITTPIYNLSIPANLKAWIDQVVRFGRTFAKTDAGFAGLVTGKRVTVLVASGSDFRPTSAFGGYNFLEPYLRAVLGFIGLTDVTFVYAHSLNQGDDVRTQALAEASAATQALAAA
ncbi:MAG: NAD(P)H-dependent oxidoreductase [Opitutaceae bacterium]|jgi:FMN-dependent NADH-azoreductase